MTTSLTTFILALQNAHKTATPGPWEVDSREGSQRILQRHGSEILDWDSAAMLSPEDAATIAHLRNSAATTAAILDVAVRAIEGMLCECYEGSDKIRTCERCDALAEMNRLAGEKETK